MYAICNFNVDCDYERVDLCSTTRLFCSPHPQFWNGYKRGSDAHCKWLLFLEFEKRTKNSFALYSFCHFLSKKHKIMNITAPLYSWSMFKISHGI